MNSNWQRNTWMNEWMNEWGRRKAPPSSRLPTNTCIRDEGIPSLAFGYHHSNDCFKQEASSEWASTREWMLDEKQCIYLASRYLLILIKRKKRFSGESWQRCLNQVIKVNIISNGTRQQHGLDMLHHSVSLPKLHNLNLIISTYETNPNGGSFYKVKGIWSSTMSKSWKRSNCPGWERPLDSRPSRDIRGSNCNSLMGSED